MSNFLLNEYEWMNECFVSNLPEYKYAENYPNEA